MLAEAAHLRKLGCVETMDRSYFSRQDTPDPAPSCERIGIDRKSGKYMLKLRATDRLRVAVTLVQGREIYSWTGPASFSRSIQEILQPGPIGTGAFASHLLGIFSNPSVRFRLVAERPEMLEYGFRVPVEASPFVVGAGKQWLPTGYIGSVIVDRSSAEIGRLTLETGELPPETSMCEATTTVEYKNSQPLQNRSHDVMRDASETDRVTAISDCGEASSTPLAPRPAFGEPLPAGLDMSLAFIAPIDTGTAAAGDVITARITEPVRALKSSEVLVPAGAIVTGRIMRMAHQLASPPCFLISVAFDTLEAAGVVLPFYANLNRPAALEKTLGKWTAVTGNGLATWPQATFIFLSRDARLIVPRDYKSKWKTTAK